MRAVVQRVSRASVTVDGESTGQIRRGFVVLVGFSKTDDETVLEWMARKIVSLRLFEDDAGKMNLNLEAVGGGLLLVSQFTLYGDCNKGTRPSFDKSAPADRAEQLYDRFVEIVRLLAPGPVETGVFQAYMAVDLVNDGPVTITIEKEAA